MKKNPKYPSKGRRNTPGSDGKDSDSSTDETAVDTPRMVQSAVEQVGLARRSFLPRIKEPESEPAVVLRTVNPCEGTFAFGVDSLTQAQLNLGIDAMYQLAHSLNSAGLSTGGSAAHGLMSHLAEKTPTVVYPYTKMADHTIEVMWPVYHSIFQSSPRDATALSFSEFITIIARTHYVYCTLLSLVNLMATTITARDDPEPFMNSMLTNLGVKMGLFKAVSKAELERVIRKVSFLPVIPGIAREANAQLSNFVNPFMPSGITIPVYGSIVDVAGGQDYYPETAFKAALKRVEVVVDSLVGTYSNEMAYLKLFLPGTIENSFVLLPGATTVDPIRGVGYYNTPSQDGSSVNRIVRAGKADLSYPLETSVPSRTTSLFDVALNRHEVLPLYDYHILDADSEFACEDSANVGIYASKKRPYFYSIMGDMIAGEILNASFYWDDSGSTSVTRMNILATPHFYGEMMLLCEEARDLDVWPYLNVTNAGLHVQIKGDLSKAASNWFRKFGIRDIKRTQATNSPTFYAGLKRCTPALRLMQIAMVRYNTEIWQHSTVSAIDSAQGGKFVTAGSDLARETLK